MEVPPIPESKRPMGLLLIIETKVKKNCSNPEAMGEQFLIYILIDFRIRNPEINSVLTSSY